MESSAMTQVILPVALFTIMLGVGLSLSVADFRQVMRHPGVTALGVSMQLVLLPVLGFTVVTVLDLPPVLAVGLMILTFAPGGATSNMITFLARGDTALSVSMTAIVSVIAPFTLPLLTLTALQHWFGTGAFSGFPVLPTMAKLLLMTVVPVAVGVWLHHRFPILCLRLQKPVKALSMLFLLLVVLGIVKANGEQLPELVGVVGPAVLLLIVLASGASFGIAHQCGVGHQQALTLGIEVGIQNAGTALLVTGTVLQNAEMSAAALTYGVLMNLPAFALIFYRNLRTNALPV